MFEFFDKIIIHMILGSVYFIFLIVMNVGMLKDIKTKTKYRDKVIIVLIMIFFTIALSFFILGTIFVILEYL